MRINWFSPLPPAKTDIGNYTARLLPELSRQAEVILWTEQESWSGGLEKYARVRRYRGSDLDWRELNRGDATVYQIGNNPLYHGDIWRISLRHPGLVVLHDLRLQDLFLGLLRDRGQEEAVYLARVRQFHGLDGEALARQFLLGQISLVDLGAHCPLTGLALVNALGGVVHSREALLQLEPSERRPLLHLPLPFGAAKPRRPPGPSASRKVYRLLVFGHLGHNRRLGQILAALASFPAKERLRLDIYGEVSNELQLREQIDQLQLSAQVVLHGYVSEELLDRALAAADLALNLRYPSMGEASGSQLRSWSQALPSLVSRTGWYEELPEDVVGFVRSPGEEELLDLHRHWQALLADPEEYRKLGWRGYEYLRARHGVEGYVTRLLAFAGECQGRVNLAEKLVQRLAAEMAVWDSGEEYLLGNASSAILAIAEGRRG